MSKTKAQVLIGGDSEVLTKDSKLAGTFYKEVREMRKHPTVKLARALCVAPLLAAEWSIETTDNAPDGAKEFIESQMFPMHIKLLRDSLFGCIDYGFASFEKVFEPVAMGEHAGKVGLAKLKSLLPDLTEILVDVETGSFQGLKQDTVELSLDESLLVNIDVEGTNWYGEPDMASVKIPFQWWQDCNAANVRYDKKLAGAHWVVKYPTGTTSLNGVDTPNDVIAQTLLNSLQSSGQIAIPASVSATVDDLNADSAPQWDIDLLSAYPTSNVAFIERLNYLDKLIVRCFGLPERAVLEGQFGTKAEAEAHADFAITNMELRHQIMVQQYNRFIVDQLLRLNYGPDFEGSVKIKVAPIADLQMQYLRQVYSKFLEKDAGFSSESVSVNVKALRDRLGVPTMSETDIATDDSAATKQTLLSMLSSAMGA